MDPLINEKKDEKLAPAENKSGSAHNTCIPNIVKARENGKGYMQLQCLVLIGICTITNHTLQHLPFVYQIIPPSAMCTPFVRLMSEGCCKKVYNRLAC